MHYREAIMNSLYLDVPQVSRQRSARLLRQAEEFREARLAHECFEARNELWAPSPQILRINHRLSDLKESDCYACRTIYPGLIHFLSLFDLSAAESGVRVLLDEWGESADRDHCIKLVLDSHEAGERIRIRLCPTCEHSRLSILSTYLSTDWVKCPWSRLHSADENTKT
jgi:hypothetical protein